MYISFISIFPEKITYDSSNKDQSYVHTQLQGNFPRKKTVIVWDKALEVE
jgi:hypothetical protein